MKIIEVESWVRKEYFDFFSKYDNPFYGIVTEIDCTTAYRNSKANNISFFAYYLHKSIIAANRIEELKFRVVDNRVVQFDTIHAAATIGREDGTFGFSFTSFSLDFKTFNNALKGEIINVQNSRGLRVNDDSKRLDVIHYSTLPWNKFTGLTHARSFFSDDTVPKITFGKITTVGTRKMLPISIDVHHGLVDGLHISQFLEEFQNILNE